MGLDVKLVADRLVSYDNGNSFIKDKEIVFEKGITHNLSNMACIYGVFYEAIWRPHRLKPSYHSKERDFKEECKFEAKSKTRASELIHFLECGLALLKQSPSFAKEHNNKDGFGCYEDLVSFVEEYLAACKNYPNAIVVIDR